MPGGGPPHDGWLHRNHGSGCVTTTSVWTIHRDQPSLMFSWKGSGIQLKSQLCH